MFFAHQNGFINSDTFVFSLSVSLPDIGADGGSGTLFGPLVGSVILNLIPTVFASLHDYHLYIYGGIILVTIVFLPRGIVGQPAADAGIASLASPARRHHAGSEAYSISRATRRKMARSWWCADWPRASAAFAR